MPGSDEQAAAAATPEPAIAERARPPTTARVGSTSVLAAQLADVAPSGAPIAGAVAAGLDPSRPTLVLPAAVVASELRRGGARRDRWLADELAAAYPAGATAWRATREADVDLVVLDDGDRPTIDLGDTGDLAVRRVALPSGHVALHPRSPRPTWALVAGFDLFGLACWALLWSYGFRPLTCALLSVGLAGTVAGVRGLSPLPLGRHTAIHTWPRERSAAARGAAVAAAVTFAVSLLAIDGLSARDALVVMVPMVAAGAWAGGADAVAVAWQQMRRRRPLADIGGVRVAGPIAPPPGAAPAVAAPASTPAP